MRLLLPASLMSIGVISIMAGSALAQTQPQTGIYPEAPGNPAIPTNPDRHIEAPGQGAQDPARSEYLEGWSRDMPKCMKTLLARREPEDEAHQVCVKILTDLGE
jgi:hypothetical protein